MSALQIFSLSLRHAYYNGASPVPIQFVPDDETTQRLSSSGIRIRLELGHIECNGSRIPEKPLVFEMASTDPNLLIVTAEPFVNSECTSLSVAAEDLQTGLSVDAPTGQQSLGRLSWSPWKAPTAQIDLPARAVGVEYLISEQSRSVDLRKAWLSQGNETSHLPLVRRVTQQIAGRDVSVMAPDSLFQLRQHPDPAHTIWLHFKDDRGRARQIQLLVPSAEHLKTGNDAVTARVYVTI
ncbi:MAG: hypothetical protein AAGA08_20605 [Pseudomonadota bacterium]